MLEQESNINNTDLPLYVFGAGGLCGDVIDIANLCGWSVCGIVDLPLISDAYYRGIPIINEEQFITEHAGDNLAIVIAISNCTNKEKLVKRLLPYTQFIFPSIIHPNSYISDSSKVGFGTIIFPQVFVGSDVKIGDFVLLDCSCHIGHNSHIGSYSSLYPRATIAGNVIVGENTLIGAGAMTLQGISIQKGSVLGIGSVLMENIDTASLWIGNPAKYKK